MSDNELFSDEVRQGRRSRYRFTQAPQWALLMTDLSDAGYRTYCLLLAHVNAERGDGAVWPQQKSLGAMLGKRGEAISRVVTKELEPLGLVDVEEVRTGANKTRRRNIYTVHEEPPAGWSGFASIQEWYAANQKRETAGQPGDAKNRVSGDAKNRYSGDAIHRASGDAKNRAENYTNYEQDEGLKNTPPPAAAASPAAAAREEVCDEGVVPLFGDEAPTAGQRDAFDEFWAAYPRKVGKGAARKAFAAAVKRGVKPDALLAAVGAHVAWWERERTAARFIPHAATWLNGERYDDEVPAGGSSAAEGGAWQAAPAAEYFTGW